MPIDDDLKIWELCLENRLELAHLRHLHSITTLGSIKARLASVYPDRAFLVSSVYLDKRPRVYFTDKDEDGQEIGDLAIIIRRHGQGVGRPLRRRMWIIQAKMYKEDWASEGSGPKEVDLYESTKRFRVGIPDYMTGIQGRYFDLSSKLGALPLVDQRHWSYLMIATGTKPADDFPWHSPYSPIWPSTHPALLKDSLTDALVEMIQPNPRTVGAETGSCSEWRDLCTLLMIQATKRKNQSLTSAAHGRWLNYQMLTVPGPFNGTLPVSAEFISTGLTKSEIRALPIDSFLRDIPRTQASPSGPSRTDESPQRGDEGGFQVIVIDTLPTVQREG